MSLSSIFCTRTWATDQCYTTEEYVSPSPAATNDSQPLREVSVVASPFSIHNRMLTDPILGRNGYLSALLAEDIQELTELHWGPHGLPQYFLRKS